MNGFAALVVRWATGELGWRSYWAEHCPGWPSHYLRPLLQTRDADSRKPQIPAPTDRRKQQMTKAKQGSETDHSGSCSVAGIALKQERVQLENSNPAYS